MLYRFEWNVLVILMVFVEANDMFWWFYGLLISGLPGFHPEATRAARWEHQSTGHKDDKMFHAKKNAATRSLHQ